MKHLNKKIFYLIIILLVLLTIYLLLTNRPSREKPDNNGANQNTTQKNNGELNNRDIAIQEVLKNTDKLLRSTQINGETYILTGYAEADAYKENKPGWALGGIIVFKLEDSKPVLFWESREFINDGRIAIFKDINTDGTDEVVWEGSLDRGRRNTSFYVYKFANDGFKIVTPIETNFTLLSGLDSLTYMKDIDKDGVQEIIVGRNEDVSGNFDIYQQYQQIYKYDEKKYYLWKEEKINAE